MPDLRSIPIAAVRPSPHQPRREFVPQELEELASSIRAVGLIQPIIVRQVAVDRYELIAGERRLRASSQAGLERIQAVVTQAQEESCAFMALVENIQRADLNPMEEAEAYQRLQTEFRLTQEELARRVGKKRSTIANILRLFSLPHDLQKALREQKMTLGHAKALLSLPSHQAQREIFQRICKEGLSVREVEALTQPKPLGSVGKKRSHGDPHLQALLNSLEMHVGARARWDGEMLILEARGVEELARVVEAMGLSDSCWC